MGALWIFLAIWLGGCAGLLLFAGLAAASIALHAFGAVVHWVPGGARYSPWRTYLPAYLARHIGAAQTAVWVSVAVVAVAVAVVIAWRTPLRGPSVGGAHDSTGAA